MFEMKEMTNSESGYESEQEEAPKLTAVEQEIIHMWYDYYGHRMVTWGSDQKVKIWRKMNVSDEELSEVIFRVNKDNNRHPNLQFIRNFQMILKTLHLQ